MRNGFRPITVLWIPLKKHAGVSAFDGTLFGLGFFRKAKSDASAGLSLC